MTKIIDLIEFHPAYGNQVRLHDDYYDEDENTTRLQNYVPIRAHRNAFLSLAKAQLPDRVNKEKVFMLTGSFGTGKSHLCLMLANYFSRKPNSSEMQVFFDNWRKRDAAGVSQVQNIRGDGRYLVAICEFGEGKQFEDMVLSAIEEALKVEGAYEISLDTQFKGALRQIENWEQRKQEGKPSGTFDDFLAELDTENPENRLRELRKALGKNDTKAIDQFIEAYEKVTGVKFSLRIDNLNAVLTDLLRTKEFKDRYRGLVILADEFGYALSEGRVPISIFHSFAELSKDGVDGVPIIFVGTGHKRFEAYGANTPQEADFRVVRDRVTEISLQSEELEQIISSLVSPKTEEQVWKNQIMDNPLLIKMANETKNFDLRKIKLFEYLQEPELLDQIVRNIYPMHPLSVFALTKMSQEIGSDARSVFSFFRNIPGNNVEGGYAWFTNETEVSTDAGDLNVYTPNFLVTYFQQQIQSSNLSVRPEVHDHIRNYIAALDEAEKYFRASFAGEVDPLSLALIALIFIYKVSGVPANKANLYYGLNSYKPENQKRLDSGLKILIENKIIYLGQSGEFEMRRSNMADIDALLNQYRASIAVKPIDFAEKMLDLSQKFYEPFTFATEYNAMYQSDKRLKRVFINPSDMQRTYKNSDGSDISLWQKLEKDRSSIREWNDRYEGTMVFVLCESTDDIQNCQQIVRSNNYPTIIVGIPTSPIPVKDKLLDLLAIQEFMGSLDYNKLDPMEKSLVEDRLGKEVSRTGAIGEFLRARAKYLDANGMIWYQQDGRVLINNPTSEYEPADALMKVILTKRDQIEHSPYNLSHPKNFNPNKDNSLKAAVEKLIHYEKPIEIDSNEKENSGDTRYLRNVLFKHGVLYQLGDFKGHIGQFELVNDTGKFKDRFTALFELVEALKGLNKGETFPIWSKLQQFSESPYGLGPYALCIMLAVAIRYLGDELRIKVNPAGFGYALSTDLDLVMDLASGKHTTAIVERKERTPSVIELLNQIYSMFSEDPLKAGDNCKAPETWIAILTWWKKCTPLEKTAKIYPDQSTSQKLVERFSILENNASASLIFLEDIKEVYSFSRDADLEMDQVKTLITQLEDDRKTISDRSETIKDELIVAIGRMFNPEAKTYLEYTDAIQKWLNELKPEQLDLAAAWQTPHSKTLIAQLQKMTSIDKTILEELAAAPGFGFGKVDDWNRDKSEEYIRKFLDAKSIIEKSLPTVPEPIWETSITPDFNKSGEPTINFHTSVTLTIQAPQGVGVKFTDEKDPKNAKQYELIEAEKKRTFEITKTGSIFLISQNPQGEFSKEIKIVFQNLDDEYHLIHEFQGKLEVGERFYKIRNPIEPHQLELLLIDFIKHLREDKMINDEQIKQVLKQLLDRLE